MRDSRDHPESVKFECVSDAVLSRLQVFLQFCMLSWQYILFLLNGIKLGLNHLKLKWIIQLLNISGYCYHLQSSSFYLKQWNLSQIQWYLYLVLLQQEVAACIEAGREHPDLVACSRTSLCPRGDSSTVCKNALVSIKVSKSAWESFPGDEGLHHILCVFFFKFQLYGYGYNFHMKL